ncbi:MAG: CBS domain-containing protein [Xanthobacteraceae bacterium]|jgi:CBS domain-containing protein
MTTITQLLSEKGGQVISVRPADLVYDAIRTMAEENVGSLVVMEGETLKGLVTERQYARHVALKGPVSPATRVMDVMETTILYARPEQSVAECMAVMTNRRVRHLPVMDDGQLIGIISIGDLVKSIISDQSFMIDQLEHFLRGGH